MNPDHITETVAENLRLVEARITAAAAAANRSRGDVTLVAVSKTFDAPWIEAAEKAGQRVFGENRVQEAAAKWPALRDAARDVELRLIGPLQTNKAKAALELFDVIETVDRPGLAEALARRMDQSGLTARYLVQVNTGEEPQKAGVMPRDAETFIEACGKDYGLAIEGLMCIPPLGEPASLHFALLRTIADRCGLRVLSMGMSADFEEAIAFGATHIRLGTAIFGSREGRAAVSAA